MKLEKGSKMKILFVPSDNNATSGAFLSMVRLCTLLRDEHGCQILVLLHCDGTGAELLKQNGLPYKKIPSCNWFIPYKPKTLKRKLKRFLCNFWMPAATLYNRIAIGQIRKLIREEQIDLVHINTSCAYVGAIAARKENIPFVWHIREFLEEDQERCIWRKKSAYRLISGADKVIAISESICRKYQKALVDADIVRIYNGIDEAQYHCENHVPFREDMVRMLIVGAINKSKGQDQAIAALKKLYDQGLRKFELIVAGKESEYARLLEKNVEEMGLSENIRFVGPQKDTAALYRAADITFMCSGAEAFGRVTVEAMMGGSLVIGANAGGTVELIQDGRTGLLYESGNADDLAEKISYALEHRQQMAEIAANGRAYMISNMTAGRNADRIFDIYNEILRGQ